MKKNIKYLIWLFIILAVFAAIVIISNIKTNQAKREIEPVNLGNTNIRTYLAEKTPVSEEADFIIGDKKEKSPVIVYEDYANIYSADLAATLDQLIKENSDLSFIVRPFFSGDNILSRQSALAIRCAGEEKKASQMRDLLFSQTRKEELFYNDFSLYAENIGLKADKFITCLESEEQMEKLELELKKAEEYSVIGAPTIFIGGEMIIGARPYDDYIDSNGDQIEGLKTVINRIIK